MKILGGIFDKKDIYKKRELLEKESLKENFWKDQNQAKKIIKEKNLYDELILNHESSKKELKDLNEIKNLAQNESDIELINDCEKKIEVIFSKLKKNQIRCFLSEENDSRNIFIEIHAGAGGTESQDWASMLRRMYLKWFDKKGYNYELISEHKGDEAGIKSSIMKVEGKYLYGYFKNESGVHRLVRISPFDSGARRHTSFASVWVYPVIDDDIKINFEEKDLRIDTYRSSGAGGQHVNTTDSAVRITHLPTKIVVQCQNERSQHKNKETCFKMLKARLFEHEIQKKEEENIKNTSEKKDIGWGNQIRSYVLQPYQLVKDLRNKTESTNPNEILNGNIDEFLDAGVINQIK